ncbi:unnamed protein product, partial [Bubo scandiacus]
LPPHYSLHFFLASTSLWHPTPFQPPTPFWPPLFSGLNFPLASHPVSASHPISASTFFWPLLPFGLPPRFSLPPHFGLHFFLPFTSHRLSTPLPPPFKPPLFSGLYFPPVSHPISASHPILSSIFFWSLLPSGLPPLFTSHPFFASYFPALSN